MLKIVDNEVGREEGYMLDELAREGARRMLMSALEEEVAAYVERHAEARDADGRRLVVRNGQARARGITCGAGTLDVRAPRVNDRRGGTCQ
jgi:putative transposase